MAIAFLLGSTGILPSGGSQGQKILQLLSIQLATPLLLLGVNIRECRQRCGPLLKSFLLASFGTILASLVAFPICASGLQGAMGGDGLKIAAALMAKNVGGGLNYIAVCRSLGASSNAVAAGLCVDNIFALVYFPITSFLAAGREDAECTTGVAGATTTTGTSTAAAIDSMDVKEDNYNVGNMNINAESVSAALTIGAVATWLGESIGGQSGGLPLATCITILFTIIFPKIASSLSSTGEALGTALLYLFFATAGAPGLAVADSVKKAFLPIGLFLSLLYGIHGAVLTLTRVFMLRMRRRRYDHETRTQTKGSNSESQLPYIESSESALLPQRLLIASSAAIGGPATAAALVKANKWDSRVAPALIVGNLGYHCNFLWHYLSCLL